MDTQKVIAALHPFVSRQRLTRMEGVLAQRTRYITVMVEDLFQPHNGSAVLRSCDAFGVQDAHIVENRNPWRVNPGVELGTAQWLTLHRYRNSRMAPEGSPVVGDVDQTHACLAALRERGYRIIATTPHREGRSPATLSLDNGPIALLFGTEKEGLTEAALTGADEYLAIPMVGFVESLNISVSAAVTLQTLAERLRATTLPWRLSDGERHRLLAEWLRRDVKHADGILQRYREEPHGEEPV